MFLSILRLLLPAAAERPVKLHKTLVLGAACLREREFSGKKRSLPIQHFEISCRTSLVTHFGKANGFLQVLDGILLANPHLMEFFVADQRVGYIAERPLNGLAVRNQSLLMLRLGRAQISAKRSPRKNGLAHLGAVGPDSNLRTHQAGESTATSKRPPTRSGQRYLRKELRLGDSDLGVRGNQDLFSLANIRPSLDQRRWHTRRHFGRKRLLHQRASAGYGLRIVAKQNADGIFLLRDAPLQVRDLRVRRIENLLRLQNVKPCSHTMLDAKIRELHRVLLRLDGLARDLELKIKLQESEISARHVAHER